MVKIKNNTASDSSWVGQLIAAGAYYTLAPEEQNAWALDNLVLADIGAGNLIVNDGSQDISGVAAQIMFLQDKMPQEVVTQLEKDDKSLALASAEGDFSGNTCELTVKIPGAVESVGRYIKEGYAFCDVYNWGIRLERAALVDKDYLYAGKPGFYPATPIEAGIPGTEGLSWADVMPDGVELGDYCDVEVAPINKGWRLWSDEGGQGGCDIDNLAGYGTLYGGCYLVLLFTKPAAAATTTKMAANLQWGSQK